MSAIATLQVALQCLQIERPAFDAAYSLLSEAQKVTTREPVLCGSDSRGDLLSGGGFVAEGTIEMMFHRGGMVIAEVNVDVDGSVEFYLYQADSSIVEANRAEFLAWISEAQS